MGFPNLGLSQQPVSLEQDVASVLESSTLSPTEPDPPPIPAFFPCVSAFILRLLQALASLAEQHPDVEARRLLEEVLVRGVADLSDRFVWGEQHVSRFRARRALQMQPTASNVAAYRSRAALSFSVRAAAFLLFAVDVSSEQHPPAQFDVSVTCKQRSIGTPQVDIPVTSACLSIVILLV